MAGRKRARSANANVRSRAPKRLRSDRGFSAFDMFKKGLGFRDRQKADALVQLCLGSAKQMEAAWRALWRIRAVRDFLREKGYRRNHAGQFFRGRHKFRVDSPTEGDWPFYARERAPFKSGVFCAKVFEKAVAHHHTAPSQEGSDELGLSASISGNSRSFVAFHKSSIYREFIFCTYKINMGTVYSQFVEYFWPDPRVSILDPREVHHELDEPRMYEIKPLFKRYKRF
jgi:hypothetical protein